MNLEQIQPAIYRTRIVGQTLKNRSISGISVSGSSVLNILYPARRIAAPTPSFSLTSSRKVDCGSPVDVPGGLPTPGGERNTLTKLAASSKLHFGLPVVPVVPPIFSYEPSLAVVIT